MATFKSIILTLQQSPGPQRFLGDPHNISKVLNNLVSNALKFTMQGSVTVTASTEMLMPPRDLCRVTINVTDTGIGVPVDQMSRIFQSFAQASASVGRNYGGSGLGLFISEQLVELMGGKISVVSVVDKGSTFTFSLDLEPCFVQPVFIETAPPAMLDRLAGARILVVEDDITNRMLLEAWLLQVQCSVVCCCDGQAALDEIANGPPFDAVLMDISMPVLDGLAATRRIRRPQPNHSADRRHYLATLPIIGISGHVFSEDIARCLVAGMTACLPKPLSRAQMLLKLTSVLELGHPGERTQIDLAG